MLFVFTPGKWKREVKSESQTICVDVLYILASVFGNFFSLTRTDNGHKKAEKEEHYLL